MAKKEKQENLEQKETAAAEETAPEATETPEAPNPWEEKFNAEHDARLRLAAEYDNYRKRTLKEKDAAYGNGKADAIVKLLPVYDNLERALQQETTDAAYKKGVELTMAELLKIFTALGVQVYGEVGDAFDPEIHNAVMHTEDENLGENVLSLVLQKGFRVGDKVIRVALVQVAN